MTTYSLLKYSTINLFILYIIYVVIQSKASSNALYYMI